MCAIYHSEERSEPARPPANLAVLRYCRETLVGAAVYLLIALPLDFAVFILCHIPPSAVNLDSIVIRLAQMEIFLAWPKRFLRLLWLSETTPHWLPWVLAVANWLIWGAILSSARRGWHRLHGIRD